MEEALAAGVKVTGCTVHLATLEVDAGPILAQEAVPVLPDDTAETLHERIKAVEHRLYPETIRRFLEDLRVEEDRPAHEDRHEDRHAQEGSAVRALLSVYDKTGLVELRRRPA